MYPKVQSLLPVRSMTTETYDLGLVHVLEEGIEMTPKSVRLQARAQWKLWLLLVLTLALVLAMASVATAKLRADGWAYSAPYAPYAAGPVVREVPFAAYTEEPYAPYTAGPVVREVPYAPYTEEPYAPYTAGPVVREEQRPSYKLPLK
jgi:uncharacterized integral membrane protein